MTLRMADGLPKNLPAGLDAYAGYVVDSGIGETWTAVQQIPARYHLSISVRPGVPAMVGDVEAGALSDWRGYTVGYCSISRAEWLCKTFGRPRKLWTAHYSGRAHLCTSICGYGFTGAADGTQWTDHGGAWDESLLADDFFDFLNPAPVKEDGMQALYSPTGQLVIVGAAADNGNLLVVTRSYVGSNVTWSVTDVTAAIHNENPNDPRAYKVV